MTYISKNILEVLFQLNYIEKNLKTICVPIA